MKIAISGCGIAGTAVAKFLADDGHEVTILEQAMECQPIGAGILMQPSGQIILKQLGILDEVASESAVLDGLWAKQTSGKTLVRLKYEWLDPEVVGFGVHRGKLFQRLFRLCETAGVTIKTDFRVVRTEYDARRKASLISEKTEVVDGFDFVIGADGSRSALRDSMQLTKCVIDYDHAALWATGVCDYQPGTLVQLVRGTEDLVGLLPIGGGQSSFFCGIRADGYQSLVSHSLDAWKHGVLEICPDAASILDTLTSFDDLTFARYRHVVMDRWHKDHVLFIGDAAHATSPHLGQGVNLALEDAACFATCLRSTGDFERACRQYTQMRKWKLRYFQRVTHFLNPFFQDSGFARGILRDAFLPWFPHTPIVRREMIRTLCGYKHGWIG